MTDGCMVCGLRPRRVKKGDKVFTTCGWCGNPIVVRCGGCGKIHSGYSTHGHTCSQKDMFRSDAGTPNKWGKKGIAIRKLNTDLGMRARKKDYAHYWFPREEVSEDCTPTDDQ